MSASVTCGSCGATLDAGDRFCNGCGATVHHCTACGETLARGAERCQKCGAAVSGGTRVAAGSGPGSASAWDRVLERLRVATANQFEIKRELGRGGMAAVYLATEIGLSRQVAIKVMSPGLLMDDSMVERFRQEAVTLANLNHAHIVPIYAVREVDDLHFFVMKFIEGRPLNELILDSSPMPVPVVRAILFQAASALASAHRRGIIHRDVKPANILLDTDGNAIVTDFGIAKVAETPGQTQTGSIIGTPAYMSPEQCNGANVGIATDQYSLGIVAYEMLTGQPPFTGATLAVMHAHAEKEPRSIRSICPDCPEDLEAVIMRMLHKDPAQRWESTTQAAIAAGGSALSDEDPLRSQLITMASTGIERPSRRIPISMPPRASAVPRATPAAAPPVTPARGATRPVVPATEGSAAMSATEARQRTTRRLLIGVAALVIISGVAFPVLRHRPAPADSGKPATPDSDAAPTTTTTPAGTPPTAPAAPVGASAVTSIVIAQRDTEVAPGAQFRVRASARGSGNAAVPGSPVVWHSSNPSVAAIDATTGRVIAGNTAGVTTIAAAIGTVESSFRLTVRTGAPTQVAAALPAPSAAGASPPSASLPGPPPPPPPSSVRNALTENPATATAFEVNPLIDGCVNAFGSGRKDRILAAYGAPGSVQDAANRDEIVAAAGRSLQAQLAEPARIVATGPSTADVSFQLKFSFSPNSFTRQRSSTGPFQFQMQIQRSGTEWKSGGCHSEAAIKLH